MQTPHDANFRNITCEGLTVKNFAGRNKVEIKSDAKGGHIFVYNARGLDVIRIGIDEYGNGVVETRQNDDVLKGGI